MNNDQYFQKISYVVCDHSNNGRADWLQMSYQKSIVFPLLVGYGQSDIASNYEKHIHINSNENYYKYRQGGYEE